jgi:hypothetical protein
MLTHTIRNATVALLLQNGIRKFIYASSVPFSLVHLCPTTAMGCSDPVTLPLLSTEVTELIPAGTEYTRVEKTVSISSIATSWEFLDVCVTPDQSQQYQNCSTCGKCMRTLATLEIIGALHRYSNVFDLEKYHANKHHYFTKILTDKDDYGSEIVDLAKQKGYQFPLGCRILAFPLIKYPRKALLKLLRLFSLRNSHS